MNYGFFSSKVYKAFLISVFGNNDHFHILVTNVNMNYSVYTSTEQDSMYVSKFSSTCSLYVHWIQPKHLQTALLNGTISNMDPQKGLGQKVQRPPSPKTLPWTGTASTTGGFSKHHLTWPWTTQPRRSDWNSQSPVKHFSSSTLVCLDMRPSSMEEHINKNG